MDVTRYKTETFQKRLVQYQEKFEVEQKRKIEQFASLGCGTNMRGYTKTSKIPFAKEDSLKEKISLVEQELELRKSSETCS